MCCEQSVKIYNKMIYYFQNTCTRRRDECVCVRVCVFVAAVPSQNVNTQINTLTNRLEYVHDTLHTLLSFSTRLLIGNTSLQ